jgi:hypothetical protein
MKTILDNINKTDVKRDPFPYIVKKQVLDQSLADELRAAYPSIEDLLKFDYGWHCLGVARGTEVPSNRKIRCRAAEILSDSSITPIWREFIEAHLTKDYLKKFLDIFGEALYEQHPHLRPVFNNFDNLRVGIRNIDSFENCDVLIDAEICIDTPVRDKPSSVKIPHLDNEHKMVIGNFYLKQLEDDSVGGSLELYKHKDRKKSRFHGARLIDYKYCEKVGELPYQDNSLAMFINSVDALHGVSNRNITSYPRYSFNNIFEIKDSLFDIGVYYNDVSALNILMRRAKRMLKKVFRL